MKTWLPESALEQCSPEPLLLRVLRQWGGHWLVDGEPGVAPIYYDNCPLPSASVKWRSSDIASIAYRDGSLWALASAMLGCSIVPVSLQPSDRKILELLTGTAIDDLLHRLTELVSPTAKASAPSSSPVELDGCAWWEVSLAPGKLLFKLAITSDLLVQLIKRELPVADKIALGSIAEGLAGQNVALSAELGRCDISLADLKGLGVGDVLVLDRLTEAPVDVIVNDRSAPFRASLDERDGYATLTIAPKEKPHA